jgi:hypothetical protein
MAKFHYNDKSHLVTGQTLFFLNYGIHPWKGNLTAETTNPSANSLIKKLEEIQREAKATLEMKTATDCYDLKGKLRLQQKAKT